MTDPANSPCMGSTVQSNHTSLWELLSHVWLCNPTDYTVPGHSTGVGSLFLLQGIFPTEGSNPGLLHYKQILYQLSHQGTPSKDPLELFSLYFRRQLFLTSISMQKVILLYIPRSHLSDAQDLAILTNNDTHQNNGHFWWEEGLGSEKGWGKLQGCC